MSILGYQHPLYHSKRRLYVSVYVMGVDMKQTNIPDLEMNHMMSFLIIVHDFIKCSWTRQSHVKANVLCVPKLIVSFNLCSLEKHVCGDISAIRY